jgi:hypothetical protein
LAVVNSEQEAEVLRSLYFNYGPATVQRGREVDATTEPGTTPKPEPVDATVHIGFHDIFIEGEYLTVRSK